MRVLRILLLLSAALLLNAGPVLILSFDALGADRFGPSTMPRLWTLSQEGLRGRGLPPFPSTTFNGHATLATGCLPGHHGIVANGFFDPALGRVDHSASARYLEREPLWIAATRSGLKAAVLGWPCADGPWHGESPWRLVPFGPGYTDAGALGFADRALAEGADLVMAYLSGLDAEGHRFGPLSAEVGAKLRAIDDSMAPWIRQQQARHPGLQIWLLADHGMATTSRRIHLPSLLEGLPGRVVAHGGSAYVYLGRPSDLLVAQARFRRAGLRVWTRSELPAAFGLSGSLRTGDLTLLAPSGTWLSQALNPEQEASERAGRRGAHAYRGQDPGMATWLVVLGTGRKGRMADLPLTAVAPRVARELGIHWQLPPDGEALLKGPALTGPGANPGRAPRPSSGPRGSSGGRPGST